MEPNTNQDPNNQTPAPTPEGINSQPVPAPEAPAPASEAPAPQPAPEAQPAPQSIAESEPTLQAKDSVIEDSTKKPTNKKTTIILVVILVILLAAAGIGFGVWNAINANQKPAPAPAQPVTPTDEPSDGPTADVTEEVELTDANIIKDLDQKIAYLHIINDVAPTFVTTYGHPEDRLYSEDPLTEKYKQFVTQTSLEDQYRKITPSELATLETNYPNYDFASWNNENELFTKVIDADVFANRYLDLFGEKLDRSVSIEIDGTCPSQYDETTNLYFQPPFGCGSGVSAFRTYFSKVKYTTTGENAYVYVNAVTVDYETGNIYCTTIDWWSHRYDAPQPCGTTTNSNGASDTYETFKEYGDRTTYRFVFKKADNGTYYFDKVEKVSA